MSVYSVETEKILGIPFSKITKKEAEQIIKQFITERDNRIIITPNPEGVMQARRNPDFAAALHGADLLLADGTGIVLASKFLRKSLPERVRGVDITFALLESVPDATIYLLGGMQGIAEKAKENIEKNFANIKVVGFHHGFFSGGSDEEKFFLREIGRVKPDFLLVCLGMPRAEIWAAAHKHLPVGVTMCVGGTIDILAGTAKLAPAWMRKIGLEWFWRLLRQPSRFRRMLDIPRFVGAVLVNKFSKEA